MELLISTQKTAVSFDQTRIFYEITHLPHSTKNIVLLHGLGGDLTAWNSERGILQALGYSTYAIDLRGHGRSEKPDRVDAYQMAYLAQDVVEVIKKEKLKHVVLVGHCLGGMVAMTLAALYPGTIESLILVDTSCKPPFFAGPLTHWPFLGKLLPLMARLSPRGGKYTEIDFPHFIGSKDYDWRRILSDILHTSLHTYLLICHDLLKFDASELLEKITVPCLVITGAEDSIFPPQLAKQLAHHISHAKLVCVPKANHIIVINNPSELTLHIHSFLKEKAAA